MRPLDDARTARDLGGVRPEYLNPFSDLAFGQAWICWAPLRADQQNSWNALWLRVLREPRQPQIPDPDASLSFRASRSALRNPSVRVTNTITLARP